MAVHSVKISSFPQLEVSGEDVEFEIKSDDKLVGILGISKGTLSWLPNNARLKRHLDWENLTALSEKWEK